MAAVHGAGPAKVKKLSFTHETLADLLGARWAGVKAALRGSGAAEIIAARRRFYCHNSTSLLEEMSVGDMGAGK